LQRFATVSDVLEAVKEGAAEFSLFAETPEVNSRGFFGNVPLMVVIHWGDIEAVQLLLDAGADIDAVCEEGNTPLHEAIESGQFQIARILLARGANRSIRNELGQLPRDRCWEGEWPGIFGESNSD
jgi:ankyrin repeat protein